MKQRTYLIWYNFPNILLVPICDLPQLRVALITTSDDKLDFSTFLCAFGVSNFILKPYDQNGFSNLNLITFLKNRGAIVSHPYVIGINTNEPSKKCVYIYTHILQWK